MDPWVLRPANPGPARGVDLRKRVNVRSLELGRQFGAALQAQRNVGRLEHAVLATTGTQRVSQLGSPRS